MKIHHKLLAVVGGGVAGTLLVTALSLAAMRSVAIGSPRHTEMVNHQNLLADALPPPLFLVETHLAFMELEKSLEGKTAMADQKQLIDQIRRLVESHSRACRNWDTLRIDTALRTAVGEVCAEAGHLSKLIEDTLIKGLETNDSRLVAKAGDGMDRIYDRNLAAIRSLQPLISAKVEGDIESSHLLTHRATVWTLVMAGIVGAISAGIGIRLTTRIAKSTESIAVGLDGLARGELRARLGTLESSSEIQRIGTSFETAIGNLQRTLVHLQDETSQLGSMTVQLQGSSGHLAADSKRSLEQARHVSDQTGKVDSLMADVSRRTSKSSLELRATSESVVELSRTIGYIASNAESTRSITHKAKQSAQSARSKMDRLTVGASEIEKILGVIQDIAEQTKLLALNATIEASRAGEAGKGFAVVASEVKQLAKQTAEATETVGRTIEEQRRNTDIAGQEILKIQEVVDEVDGVVSTIAQAVEEQSGATRSIASNMASATDELQGIAVRLEEAARSTQEIAEDSRALSGTGAEVGGRAQEMAEAASTLAATTHRIHKDLSSWRITEG